MRERLENMYWAWEMNVVDKLEGMCCRWKYDFMEKFVRDEEGDHTMVAVIVLIVIIIAVAGTFKTTLTTAVNQVMEEFTGLLI